MALSDLRDAVQNRVLDAISSCFDLSPGYINKEIVKVLWAFRMYSSSNDTSNAIYARLDEIYKKKVDWLIYVAKYTPAGSGNVKVVYYNNGPWGEISNDGWTVYWTYKFPASPIDDTVAELQLNATEFNRLLSGNTISSALDMYNQLPFNFITSGRPPAFWLFATPKSDGSVGVYSRLNFTMKRFLFTPAYVQQLSPQFPFKFPMDVIVM